MMKNGLSSLAGFIITTAAIGGLPLLASWAWDVHNDRQHTVIVNSTTPVFMGSGDENCNDEQQLTTVSPGTDLKVRRIRYWKNCATVDINLPDGGKGYIVLGKGKFSVSPPLP